MSNDAVNLARKAFETGEGLDLDTRLRRIDAVRRMLLEQTADFTAALSQDLRKHPSTESLASKLAIDR